MDAVLETIAAELRSQYSVLTEPKSLRPREVLDEILRAHGLKVRSGPRGALLVVR